jgi:pyruvate,water dikinase
LRGLFWFLELIGLKKEQRAPELRAQLARFKLYHTRFRTLLSANNSFLEGITDIETKLLGEEYFDRQYVKSRTIRAVADVHQMIESLGVISGDRYPELKPVLDGITSCLNGIIEPPPARLSDSVVLDVGELDAHFAELAGGKMANLGEIRNSLGLPVPGGFTVTTGGYRMLLESGGLGSFVQQASVEIECAGDADCMSRDFRERIMNTPVPPQVETGILAACDRLESMAGRGLRFAVRSSAPGEDSHLSFAGQFITKLNVPRSGLIDAYREVSASFYSPEAVHYRLLHGLSGQEASMAVGFVEMVDAAAGGVVYTNDPNRPDPGQVIIHAVRGLGVTLADGSSTPETILCSRGGEPRLLRRMPARQTRRLVCDAASGVKEVPVEDGAAAVSSLTDAQALMLARWALSLEAHFGRPQDVEWALDGGGRLVLLQSRPLRLIEGKEDREEVRRPVEGVPVLVSGGEPACPGVGTGPAVHMEEDGALEAFPEGAVLIAHRSSPKFVRVMSRARAIVTDAGGMTGHMASLAREFKVPTIVGARTATQSIPPGTIVTVDASGCLVYEGEVRVPAAGGRAQAPGGGTGPTSASPAHALLERAAALMVPLNLSDPRASTFAPEHCKTLHDLARFIHEKSYKEMFRMGEKLGDFREGSYYLDVFLPIDLYIIDLGGGIRAPVEGRLVKPSHIGSVPFNALLKGMLHEDIPRYGPRPMDVSGFFSVMMRHALTSPENERTFRDPCYAMISDRYLNYTARVGYHFGIVDSYCGRTANKNYVSILFRGGAADLVRRRRRARAIGAILREYGFAVEIKEDRVNARLSKAILEDVQFSLEMVGRLLQFMRQMDLAMATEESVEWVRNAFLDGDYRLEGKGRRPPPVPS